MTDSRTLALFQEFLNEDNHPSSQTEEVCMISGEPIQENAITLSCGHCFNYKTLFSDVSEMRRTAGRLYDTGYVSKREIRCPYCRQVTTGILPYIPTLVKDKVNGVNAPQKYCMKHCVCEHAFVSGKRAGQLCGRPGFKYEGMNVCAVHQKSLAKTKEISNSWSQKHAALMKSHTCNMLRELLKEMKLDSRGTKKVLVHRFLKGDL